MTINIIFAPVPNAKAATTPNDDGSYTIILSKSLNREQARTEVLHELGHIFGNDFDKEMQADLLEEMIRRSNIIPDETEIEFYCHVV